MRKSFVIGIFIVFLGSSLVHTQEQERPTPPPRETDIPDRIEREEPDRERLPEFELPEYVITGRATFRLPYVHKPKITEQNIYVAEITERMTGVDRELETSPIDIPTKTFGEFRQLPSVQHGQVRLGYGRFNTPVISGWANFRSGDWDVSGRLSYLNTEGYEDFAEGYDLDGRFQFGYRLSQDLPALLRGGRSSLTIGFEGLKYGLFSQTSVDDDDIGLPIIIEDPHTMDRTWRSSYSEIGFESGAGAPFDYDLLFGWRGSTLDNDAGPVTRLNDDELYVRLSTLGYIEAVRFRTGFEYIVNNLDIEVDDEINDPQYLRGSVTALFPIADDFMSFEVGGSIYSTRGTHADRETSLKPFAEVRVMPQRSFTIYARYAPEVNHRSLHSLQHYYPYLGWWAIPPGVVAIMPSDEKINVAAGVEFNPHRKLNVNAYTQYLEIDGYPGLYGVDSYGTVQLTHLGTSKIFSVNSDVRYVLSDRDILTSKISLRYTKNDYFDSSIPQIAPVAIAGVYTREFPFGLRASAGIEFLSPRRASYRVGGDDGLDHLINLNLDVHYQFHNIMGVYMKFDNLLNQSYERYFTYPARPFYIEGGIQISF